MELVPGVITKIEATTACLTTLGSVELIEEQRISKGSNLNTFSFKSFLKMDNMDGLFWRRSE